MPFVFVSLFETPFLFGPLEPALISHEPAKAAVVDVASVPGRPLLGARSVFTVSRHPDGVMSRNPIDVSAGPHPNASGALAGYQELQELGSSAEFVGGFRLRELTECMVQGDF
jgi:hypothetical protein